jgi:hypothetical protein
MVYKNFLSENSQKYKKKRLMFLGAGKPSTYFEEGNSRRIWRIRLPMWSFPKKKQKKDT